MANEITIKTNLAFVLGSLAIGKNATVLADKATIDYCQQTVPIASETTLAVVLDSTGVVAQSAGILQIINRGANVVNIGTADAAQTCAVLAENQPFVTVLTASEAIYAWCNSTDTSDIEITWLPTA